MSQAKIAEKKRGRGLWPVIGFLLIVSIGVISYFAAPFTRDLVLDQLPSLRSGLRTLSADARLWVFVATNFVILGLLASLVVALAAPKRALHIKEADLAKERMQREAERRMERKRQRKINMQMRDDLRRRNREE